MYGGERRVGRVDAGYRLCYCTYAGLHLRFPPHPSSDDAAPGLCGVFCGLVVGFNLVHTLG